MEPITTTVIVTLAFTKFLETSVEKFTEAGLQKIDQLREKIWNKLRGNPKAEQALREIEKGSKVELEKVKSYLEVKMDEDETFAEEIQTLAREIQSFKVQDNSSMTQNNYDSSTGYQTKVEGGTAFIGGTHYHGRET